LDSDPYDVLGLSYGAPFEEVKAAYRRRSQLLHPDHHAGASEAVRSEAEAMMRKVVVAYEFLRAAHEEESRTTVPPKAESPHPASASKGGVTIRCPRCGALSLLRVGETEVGCACGAHLRKRDQAENEGRAPDDPDDETWPDPPRSVEDAVDEICGDLLVIGRQCGVPIRGKYFVQLAEPESTLSAHKKHRLILAVEPTLRVVYENLLRDEAAATMPDGALLPESWAAAYALLDELDDPPALLVAIEATLGL
jgi:hypothetical protein